MNTHFLDFNEISPNPKHSSGRGLQKQTKGMVSIPTLFPGLSTPTKWAGQLNFFFEP